MAKGLRASTRKRNNTKLRATVFGPVIAARTERLSAKLQELAAKPRPDQERVMEVDSNEDKETNAENGTSLDVGAEEMQLDDPKAGAKTGSAQRSQPNRIEKKKAVRKARNSIVFAPSKLHVKRKASGKRKT